MGKTIDELYNTFYAGEQLTRWEAYHLYKADIFWGDLSQEQLKQLLYIYNGGILTQVGYDKIRATVNQHFERK